MRMIGFIPPSTTSERGAGCHLKGEQGFIRKGVIGSRSGGGAGFHLKGERGFIRRGVTGSRSGWGAGFHLKGFLQKGRNRVSIWWGSRVSSETGAGSHQKGCNRVFIWKLGGE